MTPEPMPQPEFSRPVNVGQLPHHGRSMMIEANAAECAALARRFGLPAIASLRAELHLAPLAGARVGLSGRLAARLTQVCVVSLEPFDQEVEAPVALVFVPRAAIEAATGALDPDAVDEEPYDGQSLDVGEAVAQTLSLALDPWPRNPDSELPAAGDGASAVPPAGPFAALARRVR